MGFVDGPQICAELKIQHQRVHQAARPGDNGCSATGATQDRESSLATGFLIHFHRHLRRAADDDDLQRRLPEPQHFHRSLTALGLLQQRLVEREVLRRCG